jgi:hypothetical protein
MAKALNRNDLALSSIAWEDERRGCSPMFAVAYGPCDARNFSWSPALARG